jgi:hypothetical protein
VNIRINMGEVVWADPDRPWELEDSTRWEIAWRWYANAFDSAILKRDMNLLELSL